MAQYTPLQRMIFPVAVDLSASAADLFTWVMPTGKKITVHNFGVICSAELAGAATTAAVVSLDYTDTVNGTARAEKSTVSAGDGTAMAIGEELTVVDELTPFDVAATDVLIVELKTQASGGTTTGAGYAYIDYTEVPVV